MPTVIQNTKDKILVGRNELENLKLLAKKDPQRRARICLHKNEQELVQEMIIAFCKDSYVRPHRHINKSESYHIMEGELDIIFFDKNGSEKNKIQLSANRDGLPTLFRISSSEWHTVIPKTDYVIIHEVTKGPFDDNSSDYPSWAPAEKSSKERS